MASTNRFLTSPPGFQNIVFTTDEAKQNNGQQKVICTPEVSLYQNDMMSNNNKQIPVDTENGQSGNNNEMGSSAGNGANGFQCGFCGKTFQQKNTFQNHLRSHRDVNGPDAYQCDICNKTFAVPARLTRHYRTHTGEKPYQCEYCNKSFSVKENLSVHRRIHTKERPYKCEVCERAFEHSGKLHRHMRIHTGERPHQCQICQKTFIQSGQLVIHMRTHTGEKPYVCKVCNKGFTCSKQLKVHTRTHTGEKPYSCEICGKSFGYNHVLKLHQVAHYGEKVYKCTLCNSTFNSKKALETHIKTHSDSTIPMESDVSVVPEQRIIHSPASVMSLTPVNSDKENRELSDSDLSSLSQNSPVGSPPHSPGETNSPVYILPTSSPPPNSASHTKAGSGPQLTSGNGNGNNGPPISNLPYPMLPPSVQVHQAPQSRTTFLYVTSKLPHSSTKNSSSTDQVIPSAKTSNNPNLNFKNFSFNGNNHSKTSLDERDKHFMQNASIRDKVLASIEKFGYGLNSNENNLDFTKPSVANNNNSSSHHSYSLNQRRNNERTENNLNRNSIPENLTFNKFNSNNFSFFGKAQKAGNNDHHFSPYSRQDSLRTVAMMREHQQQRSVISPINHEESNSNSNPDEHLDRLKSMYPSGGVLALALTRGSKVAASQLPHAISMTPIPASNRNNPLPPSSNAYYTNNHFSLSPRSQSPQELCIDFSRRQPQQVQRAESFSPSPPPPRHLASSSPTGSFGQSEGSPDEEMSDECNELKTVRSRPSSGAGPRKRSSLILEKYAQENDPAPSKTESILSQRLRLSSVIQYAEKCT